ncbi:MAG: glycosyltransferase family 2 protein [Candidatus Cloacimonetes bacterium]|nr:glycosyltransferase family 2 protein [Candidatus Cloacimonadota bacterium]
MIATLENTLILIPVYNSYQHLIKLHQRIFRASPKCNLFCVNDGSTDLSLEMIKILQINYISFEENRGKGHALKTGFTYAKENNYQFVITLDSDLQHSPAYLRNFFIVQNKEKADMVIGFRSFNIHNMPLTRVMSNYLTSTILSHKTGKLILDSQSGFRMYNLQYFDADKLQTNRYQTETELLLSYISQNAKIAHTEIPVIYGNEISHISYLRDIQNFCKLMIKEWK